MDGALYSFQRYPIPNAETSSQTPLRPIPATQFYPTPGSSAPVRVQHPTTPLSDQTRTSLATQNAAESPCPVQKRSRENTENQFGSVDPAKPAKKKRRKNLTEDEKLTKIFGAIHDLNWSLGDFLFHAFRWQEAPGKLVSRSHSVATTVQKFLSGNSTHYPAEIIEGWISCKDGRVDEFKDDNGTDMYSTTKPYTEIRPIRQCLTSFAAQMCQEKLRREARKAVDVKNGLHVTSIRQNGIDAIETDQDWADIGASTASTTAEILKHHQPLAFHFMSVIAGQAEPDANGVIAPRKRRPIEMVITHALGALDFSRNSQAKRLALARGLLYFAASAPVDLFAYESRVGTMPAYTTIYKALKHLADQSAARLRTVGADPLKWGVVILDNVQAYKCKRDMRIGGVDSMTTGTAATFVEVATMDPQAVCYDDKLRRIKENKRASLTVDKLLSLIDSNHLEIIGSLQWLHMLVKYIPQLAKYKLMVTTLYQTRAAKQQVPVRASKIYPLASNGKNEASTTELKDATLDFLEQIGQTREKHLRRVQPFGGDGSTFQNFLNIKHYLQFHPHEFESFGLLEPLLQGWHTIAGKIGRPAPPNLKKVDYFPCLQLGYTVLDARMLDCTRVSFGVPDLFQHFALLEAKKEIPEFEDLEKLSRKLFRAYSTTRSYYEALHGATDEESEWCQAVPKGSDWIGPLDDDPDRETSETKPAKKIRKKKEAKSKAKKDSKGTTKPETVKPPFTGDRVLAKSTALMRDMLICREAAMASASGDVGRFYEALKVMLFTFAGSTHTNYTKYLLETLANLELESSEQLREALLSMMVVCLNGVDFICGDWLQEHHNKLIEFMVEHKGKEFDSPFIRHIISRNLHHFSRIKKELRDGVGLSRHSAHHSDPHTCPEIKELLRQYSLHELHSRRPGRTIDESDVDNFSQGVEKLASGTLAKWVTETTAARVLSKPSEYRTPPPSEGEDEEVTADPDESVRPRFSLGSMRMVDGDLVVMTFTDQEISGMLDTVGDESDDDSESEI
ncbi:hypothetical protein C8J56DRAFT_1058311 [Mycena floridula]|nr:hypothetical protein C8J56DRAFT_1058311 [Mycena floridula]